MKRLFALIKNPMENYRNFLSKRTVIKDGIVGF